MRLSFVIPSLDQGRFISRCIDACLAQDVPGAEVIVVDGGSTDGTLAILAGYGHRIRWVSERDGGQSEAVNKGVRSARGDVIAWINSDDFYPRAGVLRQALALFEEDGELDVVYGDGEVVDACNQRIRRLPPAAPCLDPRRILLFAGAAVSQPSVLFRRDLFLAVGGLDERLHWAMDYELWIRLFERARRTAYLPVLLSSTTSHGGAKTVRGMLHQIREVGEVKRRHAPRFQLGLLDKARLHGGWASMYVYWAATKVGLVRAA